MNPPVIGEPPAEAPRPRLNWPLFLAVIFVPTVITVLAAMANTKDLAPAVALIGGGISGLAGGVLLGWRMGRTDSSRIGLSLLFVVVLGVACVTMNCFGCIAGGFKMNFH